MAKRVPYEELDSWDDVYRRKKFYNGCTTVLIYAAVHPVSYASTLIMLGHEPWPAVLGKRYNFFGKSVLFYPNMLRYVANMKGKVGYLGLYKGVGASFSGNLINMGITVTLSQFLDTKFPDVYQDSPETLKQSTVRLFKSNIKLTVGKIIAVSVARPFQVVSIRMMAQYINDEKFYTGTFQALRKINAEEGIRALFSGVLSEVVYEVCILWATSAALFAFEKLYNKFFVDDPETEEREALTTSAGQIFDLLLPFFVNDLFHPFKLISVVMAVNGSCLRKDEPIFAGLFSCHNYLASKRQLKRGSSYFMRRVDVD